MICLTAFNLEFFWVTLAVHDISLLPEVKGSKVMSQLLGGPFFPLDQFPTTIFH